MLIIFGGLPGTGKSTLARELSRQLGATYLRIDTIEHAVAAADDMPVGEAGYLVGYAVAEENLRLGRIVVADAVNPLRITRDAWRNAARRSAAAFVEILVICSDDAEHRRRVETRTTDVAGLRLTWQDVLARAFEPWDGAPVMIDTAGRTAEQSLAELQAALPAHGRTEK